MSGHGTVQGDSALGHTFRSPPSARPPVRPRSAPSAVRESKVTIKIPRPLYRRVEQVVDGSGFNSPTDFIVYVLRDLMGEAEGNDRRELAPADLDELKRKLKKLGYL